MNNTKLSRYRQKNILQACRRSPLEPMATHTNTHITPAQTNPYPAFRDARPPIGIPSRVLYLACMSLADTVQLAADQVVLEAPPSPWPAAPAACMAGGPARWDTLPAAMASAPSRHWPPCQAGRNNRSK
jgi:hypothetical protein